MTWMFGRPTVVVSVFGLLMVFLTGCGKNHYATARVTGKVLCGGKAAYGGVVVLRPINAPDETGRPAGMPGRVSTGLVGPDGSFSVVMVAAGVEGQKTGALIGPHEVIFQMPRTEPWEIADEDKGLPPAELDKMKAELARRPVYPALSCGPAIVPDTVAVKAGRNSFEFTLLPMSDEQKRPGRKRGFGENSGEHIKVGPDNTIDPSASASQNSQH